MHVTTHTNIFSRIIFDILFVQSQSSGTSVDEEISEKEPSEEEDVYKFAAVEDDVVSGEDTPEPTPKPSGEDIPKPPEPMSAPPEDAKPYSPKGSPRSPKLASPPGEMIPEVVVAPPPQLRVHVVKPQRKKKPTGPEPAAPGDAFGAWDHKSKDAFPTPPSELKLPSKAPRSPPPKISTSPGQHTPQLLTSPGKSPIDSPLLQGSPHQAQAKVLDNMIRNVHQPYFFI